jgi:hypothetical protein
VSSGAHNCAVSSYSVGSDPNLSLGTDAIIDGKNDLDASASNTFTFTVDVTHCLNNAVGGAISWSTGEQLFLDLQFRSAGGDNAAQKFCLRRL